MSNEAPKDKFAEIASLLTSLTYGELIVFGRMLADVSIDQELNLNLNDAQEWASMLHSWASSYEPEERS